MTLRAVRRAPGQAAGTAPARVVGLASLAGTREPERDGAMKILNAVVLAAALFLTPTAAAAHPGALAAAARTTAAFTTPVTEAAAPEQGRRRRPGRPNPRREQPAAPAPEQTRPTPAPARTAAPAQTTPTPAPPPGLCNPDWHRDNRTAAAVTRAVAAGADVNQACGSGSSPLLLALEYGSADVVLALIRAGASLEYRDPYTRLTANQVINDRCDAGRLDRRVCAEVRRGFEARAEAHNNLCDPRWWRGFYRQSEAQARSRMQAVMRTPGLDVNYDCGRGDRPLHIALQDSLTPLTTGAGRAVMTFVYQGKTVDRFARNRSGRSPMALLEVRYDHQIRGNYRRLLSRLCNGQITSEEYNRQNDQIYKMEISAYIYIKKAYESDQAFQAEIVAVNQELFGTTHTGRKTRDQLCQKYR